MPTYYSYSSFGRGSSRDGDEKCESMCLLYVDRHTKLPGNRRYFRSSLLSNYLFICYYYCIFGNKMGLSFALSRSANHVSLNTVGSQWALVMVWCVFSIDFSRLTFPAANKSKAINRTFLQMFVFRYPIRNSKREYRHLTRIDSEVFKRLFSEDDSR